MIKNQKENYSTPKQKRPSKVYFSKSDQSLAKSLSDVMLMINSSLDYEQALDSILDSLSLVVPNKTASIMLIEKNKVKIVRSKGFEELQDGKKMLSRELELDEFPQFTKMLSTKEPILIFDPKLNQDWQDLPETEWIKSHISAPILNNNVVIGFINCDSDVEEFFNKSQVAMVQLFASQAGIIINNARQFDESLDISMRLRMINELIIQAMGAKNLDELSDLLPQAIAELFNAKNVYITQWNQETQTVQGWSASTDKTTTYRGISSIAGGKTLTETVLSSGKVMIVPNIADPSIMDPEFLQYYNERTFLCLPLMTKEKKYGAILIGFDGYDKGFGDLLSFGEYISVLISTAYEKFFLSELERTQSNELAHAYGLIETLTKVALEIKSGGNSDEVMKTIGDELEKMGIHSLISIKDKASGDLVLAHTSLYSKLFPFVEKKVGIKIKNVKTPINIISVFSRVIENQESVFIEDPTEKLSQIIGPVFIPFLKKLLETLLITKSTKAILAPLIIEKSAMGIVSLWGENLQKIDNQAASIFGGQVGLAIENANLLQEVQRLAITDELSGVLNRRGFEEIVKHEFEAAKRYSRPLSLAFIDIDHFKQINDKHGHLVGDEILKQVAQHCQQMVRNSDFVFRFGGDELAILLVEQNMENAKSVSERIRKNIAKKDFELDNKKLSLTISIGVSSLDSTMNSSLDLLKLADKALYESKENGRNLVTIKCN